MANRRILADTSVLIEYLRSHEKESTSFYRLAKGADVEISAIVAAEILHGARKPVSVKKALELLDNMDIHPFTYEMAVRQCFIIPELLKINRVIDVRDLMIATTALELELPLATLNVAHFAHIPGIVLESIPVN